MEENEKYLFWHRHYYVKEIIITKAFLYHITNIYARVKNKKCFSEF